MIKYSDSWICDHGFWYIFITLSLALYMFLNSYLYKVQFVQTFHYVENLEAKYSLIFKFLNFSLAEPDSYAVNVDSK